jgi:hypothetical protein
MWIEINPRAISRFIYTPYPSERLDIFLFTAAYKADQKVNLSSIGFLWDTMGFCGRQWFCMVKYGKKT